MRVPTRRYDAKRQAADPHVTQQKYDELTSKLEHLKKVTRPRLMKEVATLAEGGDFSENAAYQIAKGRLRGTNDRIHELEEYLKTAIVITPQRHGQVAIGSRVTVETSGRQLTFLILGSSETDPMKHIISHNSPLGAALMGRLPGDEVELTTNGKLATYTILRIE